MAFSSSHYLDAINDFRRARQQAALQEILARLTGHSQTLLSYEDVVRKLQGLSNVERGLREIPLNAIVGSVGRYTDFTRDFLPLRDSDAERWAGVKAMTTDMNQQGLPPIKVYQIGETYFVRDGHHRVSIARQEGASHIEAYVTEVHTKVPLTADVQPDDLILKAEYTEFLVRTRLDQLRPGADLRVTVPGQYEKLEEHIQVHRYFMGLEQQREIPSAEAVTHWYDEIYLSIVQAIRERGILRDFPERTETDLYLWVSEHRAMLAEVLNWQATPEAAATDLAAQQRHKEGSGILGLHLPDQLQTGPAPGEWRKDKLVDRYADRLFADILVPLSGEAQSWAALDLALHLAQVEDAQLHGLHVVAAEELKELAAAQQVRADFDRRCQARGRRGNLVVETGKISSKICERAVLTDLVVLNVAHPPSAVPLASLGSGLRTIIWRCARPLLTVPANVTPLAHALLAYDGSPKAKEALFVAAYAAERWQTALTVVAVADAGHSAALMLDEARAYLELHEVKAEFVAADGAVAEAVQRTAAEHACDWIMLGGYGANPIRSAVVGSTVDWLLRTECCPLLICR